jgi:arylsulfatase A-like enzyme
VTFVATAAQLNVLLIMVDDLGYADLSCYGSTDMRTPHLDKLMSEGMRFNQFYANSCVCSPTRAALLSGCYPERVGIPGVVRLHDDDSWGCLTPDSIMLPQLFQKAGYRTSLIGKWHLGVQKDNRPNRRGFDEFHGFLLGMMDDYWEHTRQGFEQMRKNEATINPTGHATDLITQWSIARMKQDIEDDVPFFQYLAYNAPHFPVQPPEEWLAKVKAREEGITEVRAKMVAFVEHLDDGIGKVLKAVDDLGLRDNTIVFFTSDNGGLVRVGSNNGSLRAGKTHVYEGGIKVPACFRWPGHIKAGQQTEFRALTMDVIPTLAELCGIPVNHRIDGCSIASLLKTGKQAPFDRPEYFMWMQQKDKKTRQDTTKEALLYLDWKLVQNDWIRLKDRARAKYELYNIKDDPCEQNDMAAKMPEKTHEMLTRLEAHIAEMRRIPWKRTAGK